MTFSTNEVSRLSGATLRQLQWWDDHGWLSPVRVKADRAYSEAQALIAMVMVNLRNRGMTHRQILSCKANDIMPTFVDCLVAGPLIMGVSVGCESQAIAMKYAQACPSPTWIVPVAEFRRKIEEFAKERQ